MIDSIDPTIVKITSNGQISIPADIRRRWGVQRVVVIDRGAFAVVRGVPDEPVAMFRGRFRGPGPTTDELREREREADRAFEQERESRSGA